MSHKNLGEHVYKLIEPLFLEGAPLASYELVDVEYKKEGTNWFLRVFFDKEEGITLEDCQNTHKYIEQILDEVDPIPNSYFLEVSSPGLERPLKKSEDFIRFKGHLVKIKTYAPIDGKKEFIGLLDNFTGELLMITIQNEVIELPYDKVAAVNLTIE